MLLSFINSLSRSQVANIIIMDGQSNNGGVSFYSNLPGYLDFINTNVKIWKDSTFANLTPNVNLWGEYLTGGGDDLTNRWGSEVELSYQIQQASKTVYLVKTGKGSRGLYPAVEDFNKNSVGELHDEMLAYVDAAITNLEGQGYTVNIIAYLWMGCETDAITEVASLAFEQNLKDKFDAINTYYSTHAIRYVVPQISINGSTAYTSNVRAGQANAANDRADTVLIDTDTFETLGGGNVHFNDSGFIDLGQAYYNAISDLL